MFCPLTFVTICHFLLYHSFVVAVMPCGWGVKAGMVREWVAGKTVWSPCYRGPYLSALAMGSSHNRALYKCPITLLLYFENWSVKVWRRSWWDRPTYTYVCECSVVGRHGPWWLAENWRSLIGCRQLPLFVSASLTRRWSSINRWHLPLQDGSLSANRSRDAALDATSATSSTSTQLAGRVTQVE